MRHNLPPGRSPAPSFDKPAPPPGPPAVPRYREPCRADFSTGIAIVGDTEHRVPIEVAIEMNRLRGAALGGARAIGVVAQARDEALDLLAEIVGPTKGPMTLPSAAALEAWANRAHHLLAQRAAECEAPTGCQLLAEGMGES